MEGRIYRVKSIPILGVLGHPEWRGKRRRDGPFKGIKKLH
jgi:hypothetical protein